MSLDAYRPPSRALIRLQRHTGMLALGAAAGALLTGGIAIGRALARRSDLLPSTGRQPSTQPADPDDALVRRVSMSLLVVEEWINPSDA